MQLISSFFIINPSIFFKRCRISEIIGFIKKIISSGKFTIVFTTAMSFQSTGATQDLEPTFGWASVTGAFDSTQVLNPTLNEAVTRHQEWFKSYAVSPLSSGGRQDIRFGPVYCGMNMEWSHNSI
jgi:hypothetical protein